MLGDCEACTTCIECGRTWCRDERPSPGEPDTCDDCWTLKAALAGWGGAL